MSELREQLATYIDAIAEPVTLAELTRAQPAARRPRRALVAAMAGAMIVLVPALMLAALRWLPEAPEAAAPEPSAPAVSTTVPEASVVPPLTDDGPTSTTTPTEAPAATIAVPDLVGLALQDAESVLVDLDLAISVTGEDVVTGSIASQAPAAGTGVDRGSVVTVTLRPFSSCADGFVPSETVTGGNTKAVTVLVQCGEPSPDPDVSFAVTRRIPSDADPIEGLVAAVLAGPSNSELEAGISSVFGPDTAGALNGIAVRMGTATVDFNQRIYAAASATEQERQLLLAELSANLFTFATIDHIEFRVGGECDAFWSRLGGDCSVVDRPGLEPWPDGECSGFGLVRYLEYAGDVPADVLSTQGLLGSWATSCHVEGLDELAASEATVLVFGNYLHGATPISDYEAQLSGPDARGPTFHILDALSYPYDVYQDEEGVDVYVWPAVASPNVDWGGLTEAEIAELGRLYGQATIEEAVMVGGWVNRWSLEIDESGTWRYLGVGLT